ncbi:MAG: lamin tail domain-containing protein [Verrucomicrobiales bacterium]|nr:lamin tail domain-containing protein [Verrucomicrobiales bacterium]
MKNTPSFFLAATVLTLLAVPATAQTQLLSIEFNQDDQAGFDLWPSPLSRLQTSTAEFATDPSVTSGTTTVTVSATTSLSTPANRGALSDGTPPGFTLAGLYADLLHATSPTGALSIRFSGLNPNQAYRFTLYAWDPGAGANSEKEWSVTDGTGTPPVASVNFQDPLVDNDTFAIPFEITTTASGTFQLTNTGGLPQSAINGFKLAADGSPGTPPTIASPPQSSRNGDGEIIVEVQASGTAPLAFQWLLDGTPIAGATTQRLVFAPGDWQPDRTYTVRVTNAHGSVESAPAEIDPNPTAFPTREQLTYEPPGPASRRSGIAVAEILYHPARRDDTRELEFIELHNSQPWPENISAWTLSGDIAFEFPTGTSVPALGYLVVARNPTDVEAHYTITGVAGPWSNNLPNQGGRIRLRKPSGAIVQEINYDDRAPWPAAADGTGHSLVLARPSYGENDHRSWAPGHHIGGSPGTADPVPSSPLDHVFISAALTNSTPPDEDYLELRNPAPFPVDLSGCTMSDARDTLARFTIPDNTWLPARSTRRFTESELGFALASQGDAAYLTNPAATRVLDALQLPPAATGIPFARPRSDAPLRAVSTPGVVINEIMFHPPTRDDADEWIEITNPGNEVQNLTGWAFTDGIGFTFPAGQEIPPGGFLIIAKNRTRTLANHPAIDPSIVLGNYSGTLDNSGEQVQLSRPDNGDLVPEDTIAYTDSDRWHRFADGRGATLERLDPRGGSLAPSNWADSDESQKSSWTTVEAAGTLLHGNGSAPADQVQMFLLGPGEALVDQVEVIPAGGANVLANGGFEDGLSGWFPQGNHRRSELQQGGAFDGTNSLRLIATKRGDPGPNRVRARLTQRLRERSRATLRARVRWLAGHPEFLLRFKGNWLEATGRLEIPKNLGTPGATNSRATANAGPHIGLVTHRPLLPGPTDPVGVFAQVTDTAGVATVTLHYRIDPGSTLTNLPMRDDGIGADLSPDDGIFSAEIPPQPNRSLVAFHISANDGNPLPASSVFPPTGECLARVGEPAAPLTFAAYRLWLTQAAIADWDSQPYRANNPYPATFIYNDTRPVYAAGAYYGGNRDSHGHPLSGLVGYDVQLPPQEEILGADKLTFDYPVRDPTNQREQLMHWFADRLELPTLHRRDIYLFMNGARRGTIYHDAEQPDGTLANSHFPGDSGELFKTSNDNETSDSGTRVRPFVRNVIDVFEADGKIRAARYRWTTGARARGSRTRLDDSSIIDLMQRADDRSPDYQRRLLEIVDMDNWMRTFALIDLASFWDAFGNTNWKNTYLYKPDGGKWVQFTWDFDVGLGVFNDPVNQPLFPSNVDANIQRMYRTPAFVRSYWRAMDESLSSFFSSTSVTPVLEAKHTAYTAARLRFTSPLRPSGPFNLPVTSWIERRASFIRPQLEAVDAPFRLTSPADGSSTDQQTILLSGTAPVSAVTIEANGIPLDLQWTSVGGWQATIVLGAGENQLTVRALGSDRSGIATASRTVTYTGTATWPTIVLNEWMASNQSTLADPADGNFDDWIELANPTTSPADLSGWFLSDDPADPFKFRIPTGFTIPASGFLLVWADDDLGQNNPAQRPDLHAAIRLDAAGESILLTAPDGTLIDRVDFAQQSPDKSMGRIDGQTVALATPSPNTANGNPANVPHVTFTSDATTLRFTVTAEPGFTYLAESSDDLKIWEVFDSALAASDTITFTRPATTTRRYYRFRRVP